MFYALCEEYKIHKKNHILLGKNHSYDIINRRLDYIFISNNFKEFSNDTNIIPAFKTNHSSGLVTISNYNFLNQAQTFGNLTAH